MKDIYHISFDDIDFEGLRDIIIAIKRVAEKYDTQCMLIGALIRELLLEIVYKCHVRRKTKDVDFAIILSDWKQYDEVINDLLQLEHFTKDPKEKQRVIYKGKRFIDIIPFGKISAPSDEIRWPSAGTDESMSLSILGFKEVYEHAILIEFDKEVSIHAVSLEGLFILKIFAWNDRKSFSTKDAEDVGIILQYYFDIHIDEIYDVFWTWIESEGHNFDSLRLGAMILGYKIGQILRNSPYTKSRFIEILEKEITHKEDSHLVFHMSTGQSRKDNRYETSYGLIVKLLEGVQRDNI